MYLYSDREAFTVMKVDKPNKKKGMVTKFWMSRDGARIVSEDGIYGSQKYQYTTVDRPDSHLEEVRLGKDGRWRRVASVWRDDKNHPDGGKWGKSVANGMSVVLGIRDEYYDPHI